MDTSYYLQFTYNISFPLTTTFCIFIGIQAPRWYKQKQEEERKEAIYREAAKLEFLDNFEESFELFKSLGLYEDAMDRAYKVKQKLKYKQENGIAPPKQILIFNYDPKNWE